MRYSMVPTVERISLKNKFNVWGNKTDSFMRPFQDDYREVIRWAVDLASKKRVAHIADWDERERAQYQLAPVVYGFGDDNIQVYVLPAGLILSGHGLGDLAVLHLKNEPYSHVLLYGETIKQWLDRGVADFVIPAEDIGKELSDVIGTWNNFSAKNNFDLSCYDSVRAAAEKLSEMMSLYDPVDFIQTYLYPVVSHGFDDPESYEEKIREMLLSSQLSLGQGIEGIPSPFIKIRSFV